jgi:hypothetical protein
MPINGKNNPCKVSVVPKKTIKNEELRVAGKKMRVMGIEQ